MTACLKNCLSGSNRHVRDEKKFMCRVEDYDRTYDTPMFIFKIIGIRLNKDDSKSVRLFWNIYYWFEFANLFAAVIMEILYMIMVGRGGTFDDAVQIFVMMPCVGYVILGMVKCYKIVYHSAVFENLVKELRDMYPQGEVSEEEHRVATTTASRLNYVIQGYYFCNIILLVTYMCRPYIAELKRGLGYDEPKDLLFFYCLPFDPYQPVVYEVLIVLQTWQGHIAVMFLLSGDMMFCILLSHISTQFDLLSLRIQRLVRVPTDQQLPSTYPLGKYGKIFKNNKVIMDTFNEHEMDRRHRQELNDIIHRHRALIRLAGDMEELMSFSLLLNFCNSSIIICFCGFCSVIVEKVTDVVYKSFLVTALVQTWLLCWYGQRLVESSLGFSEALYKCGWYRLSKRNRSVIFIMIHRSQKAVRVTTYGFSVLCLASYTTIIKTAWSYFTLLLNVYRDK